MSFAKKKKRMGPIPYVWSYPMTHGKQHVKLYSPIQKHVSLLHEKKLSTRSY